MRPLILLMALCASSAWAGDATLTWEVPTTYCDGSPMATPDSYTLTYGQKRSTIVPGTTVSHVVEGLSPGLWWFSLAANVGPDTSEFVTVEKDIPAAEFVTVGGPVFSVVARENRFLLVSVGSIAPGVQCIADHAVNSNYAVPRASVTWAGSVRPLVVVAQCR
jgi:hypothetical protein